MKINRIELRNAVTLASSIIPNKTSTPILSTVRLTADGDKLTIVSTDHNHIITTWAACQESDVATCVPADRLLAILNNTTDDILEMHQDETQLIIKSKSGRFTIYDMSVDDFPEIANKEIDPTVTIDASLLHNAIKQTIIAVAKENSRYAINGVYWDDNALAGTDGRRLAVTTGSDLGGINAIIPIKSMQFALKLVGELSIGVSGDSVTIASDAATINSSLVHGNFPQYKKIIPDYENSITVNVDELTSTIRQAKIFGEGILVDIAEQLTIRSNTPEAGGSEIAMPVEYIGDPVSVGLNPDFLIEALNVINADDVKIEFKDSKSPIVLQSENYTHVLMPMEVRINGRN